MLKASDLRKAQKERVENSKLIYKKILEECHKKLTECNKKGFTSMNFTINAIKLGYPLFDVSKALHYVMKKLKKGEFKVTHIGNGNLHIDWSR